VLSLATVRTAGSAALKVGSAALVGFVTPVIAVAIGGLWAMWLASIAVGIGLGYIAYRRPPFAAFFASYVAIALASASLVSLAATAASFSPD